MSGSVTREYLVPATSEQVEYEIKKSRFIARVGPAGDREAAMAILAQAQRDYPDARHHCWAYVIGDPYSPATAACSDDGEPSGTAGKPILNVLNHKQVGNVMLVVIRYFGGIKLGAGGLVRAYSQAAQQAMDLLPLHQVIPKITRVALGNFALEQPLRHFLAQADGTLASVVYGEPCRFTLELPAQSLEPLRGFLAAQGGQLAVVDATD